MDSPIAPDAKVTYDPACDAMNISFTGERGVTSAEVARGLIVDFNEAGEPIALEVLDASVVFHDFIAQAPVAKTAKVKR